MNTNLTDNQIAELSQLLLDGKKIEAIKKHRAATGFGLAESKQEIGELEAALRTEYPEKFAASGNKSGCFSIIIISLCIGALISWQMMA